MIRLLLGCAAPDADVVYEAVWEELDRTYALFGVKGVDWDALHPAHRPAPDADDDELFVAVTGLLGPLYDNHVQLLTPIRDPWTPGSLQDARHDEFHVDVTAGYLDDLQVLHPRLRAGWLTDEVAYLWVGVLDGATVDLVDRVMPELLGAQRLVLDLRDNVGGYHIHAEPIAEWVLDQGCTYSRMRRRAGPAHDDFGAWIDYDVQPRSDAFAGPVDVLTDRFTISGGENLLLALRCGTNVRTLGTTTAGAFGARGWRDLPGGWVVSTTVDDVRDPDGVSFEGIGLSPDVEVPVDETDLREGRDPVLERVLTP